MFSVKSQRRLKVTCFITSVWISRPCLECPKLPRSPPYLRLINLRAEQTPGIATLELYTTLHRPMDRDNRVPMKMGEFSVMDTEFDNIRDRWVDEIMFSSLWVIVQVWLRDEEDGGGDEQVPERADQQTGWHLQEDIHQVTSGNYCSEHSASRSYSNKRKSVVATFLVHQSFYD